MRTGPSRVDSRYVDYSYVPYENASSSKIKLIQLNKDGRLITEFEASSWALHEEGYSNDKGWTTLDEFYQYLESSGKKLLNHPRACGCDSDIDDW